jgi:signal transduction histidine kinase
MTAARPAREATEAGLEAFAARAAHQLGEAIALVRGSASLLESDAGRLGPSGGDALRTLAAGVDRAQRFVDDLLDVTAAASGDLRPADVALRQPVDDALELLGEAVTRAGAAVEVGELPAARIDERQALRLLLHLLRAALAAGARSIAVAGAAERDEVRLEVTDDGAPPEGDEVSVLEPFARPRGRGPLVGAGMSLPVCRLIAERHGGAIGLAVADGCTTVTVSLPRAG